VKDQKALPWIVGTALLSAAILAFAWFVVISPARSGAAEDREATSQQDLQNDILKTQNAKLAKEYENLDTYKQQLQDAQTQIPTTIDQPTLSRELDALATQAGVQITDISFSASLNLADSIPKPKSSSGSSGSGTTDSDGGASGASADGSTHSSAPAPPPTMFAVPLQVTVTGAPKDTRTFLEKLQSGSGRLYLVTGVDITRQSETGSTQGKPAVHDGDYETVVTGLTYLMQSGDEAAASEDGATGTS